MTISYGTKQRRPLKFANKVIHKYANYPQHVVYEKIWILKSGLELHRIYLHHRFLCDLVTNEPILIRAQEHEIHVADKRGVDYACYEVK